MRRWGNALLVVAVACLVLSVGRAEAGKKPKLKVTISGKHFKANKKVSITGVYSSAGFNLAGVAVHGRHVQNLAFSCAVANLATATLPVSADCGGAYGDAKVSLRGSVIKGWGGDTGVTFVVTSFVDGAIRGTFSGSWPAGDTNPGDPPATFTNGVFSAQLTNAGF